MKRWVAGIAGLVACASESRTTSPATVEIVGADYAFMVPPVLPPGRTTFQFANEGKVRHELNITRLKPDIPVERFLQIVRAGESTQDLTEGPVGVLFAGPGGRSESGLTVDLRPGDRYAVIRIFRDSAEAKPHYDLGMYSVITVSRTPEVTEPSPAAVDTIIATDYAFRYPQSLEPGVHTFVMRNDGMVRHQLSLSLLKKGATLEQVMKAGADGIDPDSFFEEASFGLLHARAGQSPVGALTVDMLPGRDYVIACFFRDDENAPEHVDLGMFGTIRVRPHPAD
ncbi:MAG: hypothetical protein ACR2GK_08620 [Gemmatimonadaceae bacterium]